MTKKQKIVSTLSFLTIGAVGGHYIDDIVEKYNRFSVLTEYKMMKTCIDESSDKTYYPIKTRDTCACAVESISTTFNPEEFKQYGADKQSIILHNKYESCEN